MQLNRLFSGFNAILTQKQESAISDQLELINIKSLKTVIVF
jgi:hypothetical protein